MPFDFIAARNSGYSDAEIAGFLGQRFNFDVEAARQSGYGDTEIVEFLSTRDDAAQPAAQPLESEQGFVNQLSGNFWQTFTEGNPELGAQFLEGKGILTGSDTLRDWGSESIKEYGEDPHEKFVPRVSSAYQVESFSDLMDYLGQGLGQGLASIAVPVAGSVFGAATGAGVGLIGGPGGAAAGAVIGGRGGAGLGSYVMNYGDTYKYLKEEEGVDKETAAKVAVIPGAVMAALDVFALGKMLSPLRGKSSKEISRYIARRALQLGGRAATAEGLTEAAQQIVQELTGEISEQAGWATKDVELAKRVENVINSAVIGTLTGGTVGTATSPFARPTPEKAEPPPVPDVTEGLGDTRAPEDTSLSAPLLLTHAGEAFRPTEQTPEEIVAGLISAPDVLPSEGFIVDPATLRVTTLDNQALTPPFKTIDDAQRARDLLSEAVRTRPEIFNPVLGPPRGEDTVLLNEGVEEVDLAADSGLVVETIISDDPAVSGRKQLVVEEPPPDLAEEEAQSLRELRRQVLRDFTLANPELVAVEEKRPEPKVKHTAKRNPDGTQSYRGYTLTKMESTVTGKTTTRWDFGLEGQPVEDARNTLKDAKAAIDAFILASPAEAAPRFTRDQLVKARNRLRQGQQVADKKAPRGFTINDIFANKNRQASAVEVEEVIVEAGGLGKKPQKSPAKSLENLKKKELAEAKRANADKVEDHRENLRIYHENIAAMRRQFEEEGLIVGVGKPDANGRYAKYKRPKRVRIRPRMAPKEWSQKTPQEKRETLAEDLDLSFANTPNPLRTPASISAQTAESVAKADTPQNIISKIRENLLRRLGARGIKENVALVITDTLSGVPRGTGSEVYGSGTEGLFVTQNEAGKRVIIIALDTMPVETLKSPKEMAQYLAGVMDHETIHALFDLGILTKQEIAFLAEVARVTPHWKRPSESVMEVINDAYSELSPEGRAEEAVAELFRGHASGQQVLTGRALTTWQRILNFFRELKGALAQQHIYNAAQIFNRISSVVPAPVSTEEIVAEVVEGAPRRTDTEQKERDFAIEELGLGGALQKEFTADEAPELKEEAEAAAEKEARVIPEIPVRSGLSDGRLDDGTHPMGISSRRPTTQRSPEDPIAENLIINLEAMRTSPIAPEAARERFIQNMNIVKDYPGFNTTATDPDQIARDFIEFVTQNLLFIYDKVPPAIRERSKKWYDGGRALITRLAKQFDVPDQAVAGVMANLSPQKDWFLNVSLAERLLDIHETFTRDENLNLLPDAAMITKAGEIFGESKWDVNRGIITSTPYSQLDNSFQKAMWVRLYDEAHNPYEFRGLTPEGTFFGDPTGKIAWQTTPLIANAIEVLENASKENISEYLSSRHKVRSFFNNLLAPNSPFEDVTIDTHAVGAALLRPMGGTSYEVNHNFGTAPPVKTRVKEWVASKDQGDTGAFGVYGLYADAYRNAARLRGVLPRELQSITWEAARELFPTGWKNNRANVAGITEIWEAVDEGVLTIEEAQEEVLARTNGIKDPTWADIVDRGPEAGKDTSYLGELVGVRVPRRRTRRLDVATRSPVGTPRQLGSVEDEASEVYRASLSKEARVIPREATRWMRREDPDTGNPTLSWGTIRVGDTDYEVRMAQGVEDLFGLEHLPDHDIDFQRLTPYASSMEAFMAMMDAYWNKEGGHPRRGPEFKKLPPSAEKKVELLWSPKDQKFPIRAAFDFITVPDGATILNFLTIFPDSAAVQKRTKVIKEMTKQGDYQLGNISPSAVEAAVAAFKQKIPDKMARPIVGVPGGLTQSQIDMRIRQMGFENDIRAGIITEETPGVDPNEVRAILQDLSVGIPERLYHGTTVTDIKKLKYSKEGVLGEGIYVTPDPQYASWYSEGTGGNIIPVTLDIKNPLRVKITKGQEPAAETLKLLGVAPEKAEEISEKAFEEKGNITKEISSRARKQGYDAVVLEADGTIQEILVYSPESVSFALTNEEKIKEARALPGTKKFSFRDVEDMGVEADVMITPPETDDTLGGKVLRILGFIGDNRIDSFSDFFSWFRTSMVDMWDPARRTEVGLSEQDSKYAHFLTASSSAWAALRQARRGTAITAYALAKGVPVYRGGWSRVEGIPEDAQQTNLDGSKTKSRIAGQQVGLIPIIEPLRSGTKKSGHRFKAFHEYAIARRAARLFREGREKLLTQEQIVLYLATGHGAAEIASLTQLPLSKVNEILSGKNITRNDDFNQIFMDYQVWNSYFVQFMVDTGLITADQAVLWTETADYIPFYRQLDPKYTETLGGPDVFSGVSTRPPPPLGGKGSIWTVVINQTIDGKKVLTRLPTTFHRAEKKVAEGYAKKIAQENTGSTQGTPEFKVSVISGGMPIGGFLDTVSENALAAVQTGLMNVGVQRAMRNLVLVDPETTTRMPNPPAGKKPPPGAITFRVKGNPVTLHVGDTMLYSSFLNLNKQVSPITNMIGMPARVLRELITRSPDFMVANMLRDSLSAWVTSGRNITPLASTFTGFYKAMRGDKSADALAAAGLMTGFDFGGDPSKMTQFIEKELLNYEYPSEARKAIRNPLKYIWDATGTASRSSDAATRIAVYNRVLQETGDEAQAIFEAQEVINFSARGSSPLLQFFAATVPFLNARIQGIDVLYRSSMGKKGFSARPESDIVKRRFLARAITVASTSAMYWVLVHDDEEYINQNPEL